MLGAILGTSIGQFLAPDPKAAQLAFQRAETKRLQRERAEALKELERRKSGKGGFWDMVAPDPEYYIAPEDVVHTSEFDTDGDPENSAIDALITAETDQPAKTSDDAARTKKTKKNNKRCSFEKPPLVPTPPSTGSGTSSNAIVTTTPCRDSVSNLSESGSSLEAGDDEILLTPPPSQQPRKTQPPNYNAETLEAKIRREQEELQTLVLEAAKSTAETLASTISVWEDTKNFFTLCANPSLTSKTQTKMKRKLLKNPRLFRARAAGLGMVPDGFAPLHCCANAGNLDGIRILLELGGLQSRTGDNEANEEAPPRLSTNDRCLQGRTALHIAAERGYLDIVTYLRDIEVVCPIGEDAPVDLIGRTPLGWAAASGKKNQSSKKNQAVIEFELFSPGDRSVCPHTPATDRMTPHKRAQRQQQNSEQSDQQSLNYAFSEIPGWRVDMEDAVACHSPLLTSAENDGDAISLFGVFDGHGDGGFASQFLAREFACTFLHHYRGNHTISSDMMNTSSESLVTVSSSTDADVIECEWYQAAILQTCLDLDEQLRVHPGRLRNGGSTAIVCLVTSRFIITANVGDCRAILVDQTTAQESTISSAKAIPLSVDHKPDLPRESERAVKAGLMVMPDIFREPSYGTHNAAIPEESNDSFTTIWKIQLNEEGTDRIAVSRAFGDFEYKANDALAREEQALVCTPEFTTQKRTTTASSLLVMACDGIWDVVSNEECASFIHSKGVTCDSSPMILASLSDDVTKECLERGSRDNMSVLIVALPPLADKSATADSGDNSREESLEVLTTTVESDNTHIATNDERQINTLGNEVRVLSFTNE